MLAFLLILMGISTRLVPHPWNATPLAAIALFGGAILPKRTSLIVPVVIVALSDVLLGLHATIPFTWGSIALISLLGWWVRNRPNAGRILLGSIGGSCLFFLITNFGAWLTDPQYVKSLAGLGQAYVAGIPFFRGTLAGDLVYNTALFSAYALASGALRTQQATS